jgi:two-component sensor histidine kinase
MLKSVAARLPYKPVPGPHAFAMGAGLVAGGTLLRLAITPLVGDGVPFITFFPLLLISAVVAGALAGATVLVLSSFVAAYLWLTPRNFAIESGDVAALLSYWIAGGMVIVVATLLRALISYLVTSEARANVVAHEMKHRVGNMLAVIQAIARQTRRGAATLEEFGQVFQDRLDALARAQDVIQEHPNLPTSLRSLIERVVEPFGTHRFMIGGPDAGIDPVTASSLALLVHELGTNAMKYGALSNASGTVSVRWKPDGGRIVLIWIEGGGPQVASPARSGFGSKLLRSAFSSETGEARIDYAPTGVRCTISFAGGTPTSPVSGIGQPSVTTA